MRTAPGQCLLRFFFAAHMLSTKLGYGLPAFLALRLAEAFCLTLSFLAARFFPFGFGLLQGADSFFFAIGYVQSMVSRGPSNNGARPALALIQAIC